MNILVSVLRVNDPTAYKCLGNGWTVEVIMHILQSAITS